MRVTVTCMKGYVLLKLDDGIIWDTRTDPAASEMSQGNHGATYGYLG